MTCLFVGPTRLPPAPLAIASLDPRGVGARTIIESLLLQLDPKGPDYKLKHAVIQDHLVDINKNKRPKVARELGISIQELNGLIDQIAKLDPRPGRRIGSDRNAPVHPDVVIEWIEGRYEIRLEDSFFPRIRVNPDYRRMLQASDDPKVKDYVRKKIENAKWLVDAIQQRQNTLYRVCEEIFAVQTPFLDYGPSHLRPLKMQEVADRVGIHVSTVSRAVADKWLQTPRGLVPLRKCFSGGTETDTGQNMSWEAIKAKLKDIVDAEDKSSPMSDAALSDALKEAGIEIARRTVVKYRQQLDIPPARRRKTF